ncbi:hypothetical protein ACFYPA_06120 [Streptomyces sp. NPDC005775]|uniref:hypothetical protein n=1 Tax=Streptomyces sp. NPDC005775 TaxID=3364729 RepID=UPI0036937D02
MHPFSVDYRKEDTKPGTFVNRGFWLHDLPRPLATCRLFGHKPVVDGTDGFRGQPGSRWVCCDRCGTRPNPQGHLDPNQWNVGDRYAGPYVDGPPEPMSSEEIKRMARARIPFAAPSTPGPWPTKNTGVLGGQLILGKSFPGWSVEFKVGNKGSEHTLAAHIRLHPFGALYLHTERFGTWLVRRLNPKGYQSKVIGLGFQYGGIDWKLWARRDESSRDDPWWMSGTIKLDPRDKLLGRSRYDYTDVGDPVVTTVRMPHGDDHSVKLRLQHCTDGRNRRKFHSWTADWTCRPGIPTKPHGGVVCGSAVEVSTASVNSGTWAEEAKAAIALEITALRTRYGFEPSNESA